MEEQSKSTQNPEPEQHEGLDVHNAPPAVSPPPKGSRSLLIALIVSAVFLIAAAILAIWLVAKPASTTSAAPTGDGSSEVKKLSFVAPATLPANYARRDQNTPTTQLSYYIDANTDCSLTTVVQPAITGKTPKDLAVATTQTEGITTTNTASADGITVKDTDTKHSYNFAAVQVDQSVALLGVAFNSQHSVVTYKQFNISVASIAYTCRADTWDSKKAELAQLAAAFSVKTEK